MSASFALSFRFCTAVLVAIAFLGSKCAGDEHSFVDPAPPTLQATPPTRDAVPLKNPDATNHVPPKPLSAGAVTSDWTGLLGPTHNAFSPETHLLDHFDKSDPILLWEMTKGEGYAAPVILGERLVLFHRIDDQEIIDCLEPSDGRRYWRFTSPTAYTDRYGYCNGPRSTPVIAGNRLFSIGAEGKLHCIELSTGRLLWKRDLMTEFKLPQNFFGVGASPLADGNLLIVNVGAPGGPCVAGFDQATGKMLWGAGDQWGPSYATPVPADLHGHHRVLVFAGGESHPATGGLLCIDPANGHVDFAFPWRGHPRESVTASSPVVIGNRILISECYGSGGVLLDVAPDLTAKTAWTNETFGTHFMTAIPIDGYLYGIDGHGPLDAFFCCIDLKSGKEIWRTRPEWDETVAARDGSMRKLSYGTDRCNLLMVDGRCLCLGEYGHLLWLDLNPKGYRELSRTWLFPAGETWTPPVLSHGLLYVCQNTRGAKGEPLRMLCYDLRAP